MAETDLLYDVGTVAVNNGSATVTGTGTLWNTPSAAPRIKAGDTLVVTGSADKNSYKIKTVNSDTSLTLERAFQGSNGSGLTYHIYKDSVINRADTALLMEQVRAAIAAIAAITASVTITANANAVNKIGLADATAGNAPQISATGTDTNVALRYATQGTGEHIWRVNGIDELKLSASALYPNANDGLALGSATLSYADLFLASGGVINWNNGDVTATHAANSLAFAGASSGYSFDANITLNSTAPVLWLKDNASGASAVSNSMAGLALTGAGHNTTSKYTPAIKFGSTDGELTTTNPKFGALIAGYAIESYSSDIDGGMGLEFFVTGADPGASGNAFVSAITLTSTLASVLVPSFIGTTSATAVPLRIFAQAAASEFSPDDGVTGPRHSTLELYSNVTGTQGTYGAALVFGAPNSSRRRAAIAAKFTGANVQQMGLAFFAKASTTTSTDAIFEAMELSHLGDLTLGFGGVTAFGFIPSSSSVPTNGMYLPAANTLGFSTNSGLRWSIMNDGHFLPAANSTYDVGSTSLRVRTFYAQNALNTSDRRVKDKLTIADVLDRAMRLPVYEFDYYDGANLVDGRLERGHGCRRSIGVIAQEARDLFPEIVFGDEDKELLSITESKIGVIALAAVQQHRERVADEIAALQARIAFLESKL